MGTAVLPCSPPPPSDPCAAILQKIMDLINRDKRQCGGGGTHGLVHRFQEQINGQNGPGTTSWDNHQKAIEEQQRALEKQIRNYTKNGCGGPPPVAFEWATKRVPQPAEWKGPQNTQMAKNAAKAAGAVVGLAAVGYIAYRVIRFLPSLAPPLWWSIGPNLAIP